MLEILDRFPQDRDERERDVWRADLERSLTKGRREWVSAVGLPGSQGLSQDRAWVLLSWVEDSAPRVANERRSDLVETAAFAMSLLEASPLDRRDVMVVASLVRRSADLAGVRFSKHARRGCRRAAALGEVCLAWLQTVSAKTPATHEELWDGSTLRFRRPPVDIDFEGLQRWFEGKD